MMTLIIDSKPCDLQREIDIPIGFSLDKLGEVAQSRNGRSVELTLLSTPANEAIFGSAHDIYAAERFNDRYHEARIEEQGAVLLSGVVVLLEVAVAEGRRSYRIRISEGGAEWAKRGAKCAVGESAIDFSMRMLPQEIAATWEGEHDVRFLPVSRNRFTPTTDPSSLLPVGRVLGIDDYHPFVSVRSVLRSMFAEAGYEVQSRFFDGPFFGSLMFSGEYPTTDTSRQRAALDFKARRKSRTSATADALGRVAASVGVLEHSVGNIVDTANPVAVDEAGEPMSDTFTTGSVFGIDEHGYCCYRPTLSAKVGFLLHLEYETDFRIESRSRLKGFDTVEILPGTRAETRLTNSYADRRSSLRGGSQYTLLVFDFAQGEQLQLSVCNAEGAELQRVEIGSRAMRITMPAEVSHCVLMSADGVEIDPAQRDWALYDGYVEECGRTQVVADIRIAPEQIGAGTVHRFDGIFFGGAEPGMTLTLSTRCSLAPYFTMTPGYGSRVEFADVARNNFSQLDLLAAVQQMFNLAVLTDERTKTVTIEPFEQMYADAREWDWSERIDHSEPIALADAGLGVAQWQTRKYLDGDYASERFNAEHDTQLGVWSVENRLYGAAERTERIVNPLFTTGVNTTDFSPSAPAASVMCVGDSLSEEGGIDTPFTPHIILYAGLQPLPDGQSWGYPAPEGRYPLAAFHFAGDARCEPFTLCFEDRDGAKGLHRYFDDALHRQAKRQTLTLTLQLTAAELDRLFNPDGVNPSLRDTFRLSFCGESSLYRLSAVERFASGEGRCRCRFIRLTKD